MGLLDPTFENLAALACTYSGYHAVRNASNLHASLTPSFNLRTLAARLFAETFHSEAAELQLQCRRPFPLLNSFASFSQDQFAECFSTSFQECAPSNSQLIVFAEHHLPDALRSDDFPLGGLRFTPAPLPVLPPVGPFCPPENNPAFRPGPVRPARPPSRPVPSARPTRPPDPPRRATQSAFMRAAEPNAHNPFLGASPGMYSPHGVPPADVPRSSVGTRSATDFFVQLTPGRPTGNLEIPPTRGAHHAGG